jgi:alkanesulfonate monooxygenase SsuD/methylene tetrahydromethanopterin reductase-like flavin-dependent oxidoreductase (luciferase family)
MKFFLSGLGNLYSNIDIIREAVIEADRLGFDGAIMPDHYMWGDRVGHSMLNPYSTLETWTTLTYLAGKTEQIKLGTLVTPIPFRPPGMLAKMLSTLDILSEGRVILGVGAGWSRVEFEGYSVWGEAKYRVDKTIEGLELILRLWKEEEVTFKGRFYEAKKAVLDPKPIQKPHPKLLFGSTGNRMLKLTGKYGDICFIPPWVGPKYSEIKTKILRAAEESGRTNQLAFMMGGLGSRESFDLDELTKKIETSVKLGAKYYLTSFPRNTIFDSMKQFAEEILPSFK